ncbi:tetratricopeptide repeat protein [Proteus hauseri]|uniref:tetratricopeptide repeat protein n=1 Tax=Proteus hauseri TaxID=183417 RepID=UPI0032DAE578
MNNIQKGYDFYEQGEYQKAHDYFLSKADDNAQAAFSLAMIYWDGENTIADKSKAEYWLVKSANSGNRNALYNLGYFRYHDKLKDTPEDLHGLVSLNKAAELGLVNAQVLLGEKYFEGDDNKVEINIPKSKALFTQAAEQNSKIAKLALAAIAYKHEDDAKKAIEISEKLLTPEFPFPALLLASIYQDGGKGVEKDDFLAEKYKMLSIKYFSNMFDVMSSLEPTALSFYGYQTEEEKQKIIDNLVLLANKGNENAIYALFEKYTTGDGVKKSEVKALSYLQPLIDKKDPKALYLHYITTKKNTDYLLEAAKQNYPDAVYRLYQIYSNTYLDEKLDYDMELADKYLTIAADLKHKEALFGIINNGLRRYYDEKDEELDKLLEKYTGYLLENYSNDAKALMLASLVYSENSDSALYDLNKSFELNLKASELSTNDYNKSELAYKYGYGLGTKQDLEKAVTLYKELINKDDIRKSYHKNLIVLYYRYDINKYIDKKEIMSFIKNDIENQNDYRFAYYYADELLKENAEKNKSEAFDIYLKANEESYNSLAHYAKAIVQYKEDQKLEAINVIVNILSKERYYNSLTKQEKEDVKSILFKYGADNDEAKKYWVYFALSENNSEAQKLVDSLLDKDPIIAYEYAIANINRIKDIDSVKDEKLKSYYDYILSSANLNNADAIIYVIENLNNTNYIGGNLYFKDKFRYLTGIQPNQIINWYEKCANAGEPQCLYDLGEIYQKGNYDIKPDFDKALYYYNQIKDPDFSFLKWRLDEIKKGINERNDIIKDAENGDAQAYYKFSQAYKYGRLGLEQDDKKWLSYLEKSANAGYEEALEESIDYYSKDELIKTNKAKLLKYYEQLVNVGNRRYTRDLAEQYLQGSLLVEANRAKARAYFIKMNESDNYYLRRMDEFDLNLQLSNESVIAQYQVGNAYLAGNGVKQDAVKALIYLKAASEQGHKDAIYAYAKLLMSGSYDENAKKWVIEPNWNEAIIWLKKYPNKDQFNKEIQFYESTVTLALKGDTDAILAVANKYRDDRKLFAAKLWYEKSLNTGNLAAIKGLTDITEDDKEKRQWYILGAKKGDLYSEIQLAKIYLFEPETTIDSANYKLAIEYLEKGLRDSDNQLSLLAFDALADLYGRGTSNKDRTAIILKDIPKYLNLLETESNNRNEALIRLFDYYAVNEIDKALPYLYTADERGSLTATRRLFEFTVPINRCNAYSDIEKASQYLSKWLEKSQENDESKTGLNYHAGVLMNMLGDAYLYNVCKAEPELDKAIYWYQESLKYNQSMGFDGLYKAYLEKGDAKEAYYYALLQEDKVPDNKLMNELSENEKHEIEKRVEDYRQALKFEPYREMIEKETKAAEAGDGKSAYFLANFYSKDDVIPKDTAKMLYFYELAGKSGNPWGYNALGRLYREGKDHNIKQDGKKALYYYDLGAQLGDSNTAHLAGDMLYLGQAKLEKDYIKAAQYYEQTDLTQGVHHGLAKYKLAYMYYEGLIGTKSQEDLQKAYDNLQLAAKYQDESAISALKEWDFSSIKH